MQPNSDQQRGGLQVPSSRGTITPPSSRQAAADLMRQQIDKIYDEPQPNEQAASAPATPQQTAQPTKDPYAQTHSQQADITADEQNAALQAHWQKYHSAWQQYYQMYYERYYQAEIQKHVLENTESSLQWQNEKSNEEPEVVTKDQAVVELRSELLKKVRDHTDKIKKSRHFMPFVVALIVALSFIFLQYNQIIYANILAYTSPAAFETVNNYVDQNTDVAVGPEPLLKIPKIGVEAPVVYDVTTLDEQVIENKLQNGVVHYPVKGADAFPGQLGNTVILGHSANDVFAAGNYKFIFLRLDKLEKGDPFYLNYQGKRYTYVVSDKKIISPDQVSELAINNGKPLATLVTCTPVGTSRNRLLIIGEQVAPDPTKAVAAEQNTTAESDTAQIGGGTKGFFERLFSGE